MVEKEMKDVFVAIVVAAAAAAAVSTMRRMGTADGTSEKLTGEARGKLPDSGLSGCRRSRG